MIKKVKRSIFKLWVYIDERLKFASLKPGETGIQIGFDMGTPLTSDLFSMCRRVLPGGKVYGIDPDPFNINFASKLSKIKRYNCKLIQAATHSDKGKTKLRIAQKPGWNQVDAVELVNYNKFTDREIEVTLDTLDNIIETHNIEKEKISHVNITNNGAEYETLKGMEKLLAEQQDLFLTIVSGRQTASGIIDGVRDYLVIQDFLKSYGFKTKFRRINQLVWWGFFTKLLMNRRWVYNQKNYGVIFASKGDKKIKWYQSFS